MVAGWGDFECLRGGVARTRWVPTATPVALTSHAAPCAAVRVGFIGNFAHAQTLDSARRLLASPLGADPGVRIVLAGRGSRAAVSAGPQVEVLGGTDDPEELYGRIDCAVVPVASGAGMKCKLAEAIVAGRPVLTTELGADGYPPALRRWFAICEPQLLDATAVRKCVTDFDAAAARTEFVRELGWNKVVARYREAIEAALMYSGGQPLQ